LSSRLSRATLPVTCLATRPWIQSVVRFCLSIFQSQANPVQGDLRHDTLRTLLPSSKEYILNHYPPNISPKTEPPKRAAHMSFLSSQCGLRGDRAVIAVKGIGSRPGSCRARHDVEARGRPAVPALQAAVRFGSVKLGWMGPHWSSKTSTSCPHDGVRDRSLHSNGGISHGLAILLRSAILGRVRVEGLDANVEFRCRPQFQPQGLFFPACRPGRGGRPHNGQPGAVQNAAGRGRGDRAEWSDRGRTSRG